MLLDELLADDEEEIVDYEDDASRDAPPADERTDRKRARSDSDDESDRDVKARTDASPPRDEKREASRIDEPDAVQGPATDAEIAEGARPAPAAEDGKYAAAVKVRGLPWATTAKELCDFLRGAASCFASRRGTAAGGSSGRVGADGSRGFERGGGSKGPSSGSAATRPRTRPGASSRTTRTATFFSAASITAP